MPPNYDDPRTLARAATLVENRAPEAQALLAELFPRTGRALTVGITGAPGAGKSTLVNAMISKLRAEGRRVGVIAVDPSSAWTGGAILGDRVRMQDHHSDSGVFIRSMATRGHLGGVASATLELMLLLDGAGFDTVLVETVGVGQDEIEIARLADVTVVVLVPGMGDEVQAMKAGIMEIAHVFLINKADYTGAAKVEIEIRAAGAAVPIVQTIATEDKGIDEALAAIRGVSRADRKSELWRTRLLELVREKLLSRIPEEAIAGAAARIARHDTDPYTAADDLLSEYFDHPRPNGLKERT